VGKKQKMRQFAETKTFPNFFQVHYLELQSDGFEMQGKWNKEYFKNDNPIVLELGCGKGDYVVGLARRYPNKNFIGVDLKGNRMWRGAKDALDENLTNVAFVRGLVQNIGYYFGNEEISEIWITFPDPHLESPRVRKRLTFPTFFELYKKVLKKEHLIHLKTDNEVFYNYTLDIIKELGFSKIYENDNLYKKGVPEYIEDEVCEIKTYYEEKWLKIGRTIHYVRFVMNNKD